MQLKKSNELSLDEMLKLFDPQRHGGEFPFYSSETAAPRGRPTDVLTTTERNFASLSDIEQRNAAAERISLPQLASMQP